MLELTIAQIIVASLAMVVLLLLETSLPFITDRKFRIRNAIQNSGLGVFNAVLIGFLFGPVYILTANWTASKGYGLLNLIDSHIAVTAVLGIFLLDLWMYVWHRANHRIPFLWRFHKVHHSDREMDVTTSVRFHTGEIMISAILRLGVVVLLGLSVWQILVYDIALIPLVFFHHSNVRFPERFDRALRKIFTSPAMHRIHHSPERIETDSNYGTIFSFWDRLARSYRRREEVLAFSYGLKEYDLSASRSLKTMLLMPFMKKSASRISSN